MHVYAASFSGGSQRKSHQSVIPRIACPDVVEDGTRSSTSRSRAAAKCCEQTRVITIKTWCNASNCAKQTRKCKRRAPVFILIRAHVRIVVVKDRQVKTRIKKLVAARPQQADGVIFALPNVLLIIEEI